MNGINWSSLQIGKGERGAVIGMTGTGKSFLAKRLLPKRYPLAIIDPKRSFQYDVPIFSSAEKVIKDKPSRFIYRPEVDSYDDLEELSAVYKYCYDRGNIMVYTDDVVGVVDRNKYPRYLQVCYQLGRERNVSCLSAFQRPAWLPMFLLSEANKLYIFRLTQKRDVQRVEEVVHGYGANGFASKHHFYFFDVYRSETAQQLKINIVKPTSKGTK